jgi:hypothetical protein
MDDFRNSATTLYSNGSTSYDLGKSLQLYSRGLSTVQGIVLTKTTCTVTQQTLPAAVNLHEEASSSSC